MDAWQSVGRLPKDRLIEIQAKKLHSFVTTQVYPFSPHYRQLFDHHKIKPDSIRTIDDLRRIPFTSKTDFVATPDRPDKFRDFILQPDKEKIRAFWPKTKLLELAVTGLFYGKDFVQEELGREYRPSFMTFTTGTTTTPISYLYSSYDIRNLHLSGSRMINVMNIADGERIVNVFPFAPHLAFWQVVFGGLSSSVLCLSTGGGKVMGTEGNIAILMKMKPSVILGVPSYVYHILRAAQEKGCRMDFVQKVVLGAARVTVAFKQRLVELLESMGAKNVSVFGTYGFTEARSAWVECPTTIATSSGYHLYPDKEIFEVIDPKTGEVKREGEDGELVYTGIDARGSCVLRYRTGDFVRGGITYEPCPHCGRTMARISNDITRLSDTKDLQLSKVKGSLVNFNNFTTLLSDISDIVEWQLEIRKKDNDPFEVDEVIVYVAVKDGCNHGGLSDNLKKQMTVATEVTPNDIIFLPLADLVKRLELETANKEKRILDARPKN